MTDLMTAESDLLNAPEAEKQPATFETPDGGEMSAAIGLGLAVLRKTGYATWSALLSGGDEVKEEKFGALHFTAGQMDLLHRHQMVLETISPGVTPSPCTECEVPVLVGKGVAGNTCTVTNGCKGKPAKPAAAKLAK
ncbi:hypothetical protein LG293_16415 (plasmid) [Citricoccus nitrophenolicus]